MDGNGYFMSQFSNHIWLAIILIVGVITVPIVILNKGISEIYWKKTKEKY